MTYQQNAGHIQQALANIQPATEAAAEERERFVQPPTDAELIPEFRESMKHRAQALGLAIHAANQANNVDSNATDEIAMIKCALSALNPLPQQMLEAETRPQRAIDKRRDFQSNMQLMEETL